MPDKTGPIRPTDADARTLACDLIRDARIAALGFTHPDLGLPFISRIAIGLAPGGGLIALLSDLALHTRALRKQPQGALLLGEAGPRGDPLNSPRLSLAVRADFPEHSPPERQMLREAWLAQHPKSKLYVDFADFGFATFTIVTAALNGGFGRAYNLTPEDLGQSGLSMRTLT